MQIQRQKCGYKDSFHYIGAVVFLFVLISGGPGCAGTQKTTKTETTVTYPNNKGVIYQDGQQTTTTVTTSGDQQNREVVETSETTTTTETQPEHPGIISSTLHAVGYVIALPFIIIGGLFRIIFGG